ncbi:hypothetical protein ACLOJK_017527 [Asimina triloba]
MVSIQSSSSDLKGPNISTPHNQVNNEKRTRDHQESGVAETVRRSQNARETAALTNECKSEVPGQAKEGQRSLSLSITKGNDLRDGADSRAFAADLMA